MTDKRDIVEQVEDAYWLAQMGLHWSFPDKIFAAWPQIRDRLKAAEAVIALVRDVAETGDDLWLAIETWKEKKGSGG